MYVKFDGESLLSSFESRFCPSPNAESVLRNGKIIGNDETPNMMVDRVVDALAIQEAEFTGDRVAAERFASVLGEAMDHGEVIMSTPIMTNAGRYAEKPLSACTVPRIDLRQFRPDDLRREITAIHEQGMGTGFNLNEADDPLAMLRLLNEIAKDGARSGREDRPVGNMAVLSVYHPRILDFIRAKVDAPSNGDEWKFNLSVDIDGDFMDRLDAGDFITLDDGSVVRASSVFEEICAAAQVCADPGLIFLDRMNARNPLPGLGEYKTTAPCAEVGLIEGETCQFGYINVGKFVNRQGRKASIDYQRLEPIVCTMMHALDNALEISSGRFNDGSQYIAQQKRKVGIGLCGVADAITLLGLSYNSSEARILMQDVLSFVNYASKEESIRLAEMRGSCGAMEMRSGNRHLEDPLLLDRLYGERTTHTVAGSDWNDMAQRIAETRKLRNISTIALPPTGRSALIIDASTGIEPHFNVGQANPDVLAAIREELQTIFGETEANRIAENGYFVEPEEQNSDHAILASARDISPQDHVSMAAALQEYTDEAISKTVNLPEGTTADEISDIYLMAHRTGMSGATVYVDGTYSVQPKSTK